MLINDNGCIFQAQEKGLLALFGVPSFPENNFPCLSSSPFGDFTRVLILSQKTNN